MKKTPWKGELAKKNMRSIMRFRHDIVGQFVKTQAKLRAPVDEGALRNAIDYFVLESTEGISTIVGVRNIVYAAIQEFGGEIRPVNAKALTIPIHPDAKGRRASDFPDLFMINRKSNFPLLVRKSGGDKSQKLDIMFILLKSVTIPAKPYLRPALLDNKSNIRKILRGN